MKRPMTTQELFNRVCEILEEKGLMPDILDYRLATDDQIPVKTYQFALKNNLDYGSSEGIYLDLWIEYFDEDERCRKELGTFKTLKEDREGMHTMAALLADFILEVSAYVNASLDAFTWEGADVRGIKENGEREAWAYSCGSMERALKKKDELSGKYPKVIVRDNATREEKIYSRKEHEKKNRTQNRGYEVLSANILYDFLEFCKDSGFISEEDVQDEYDGFRKLLCKLIQEQQERFKPTEAQKEDIDFLKLISKLYKKGKFRLADSAAAFRTDEHDGLIYYECLCLRRDKLEKKLHKISADIKINDVINELVDKNALKRVKEKNTVKISTLNKSEGTHRFYAIWLHMLDK